MIGCSLAVNGGFVTVNFGTDNITFLAGLHDGTFHTVNTFGSGGVHPSTALAVDANGDGFLDLLAGNNGDGTLALFLGEAGGFESPRVFDTDLNPSALALSSTTNRLFYATSDGIEQAVPFSLDQFGID